jgi:hypothetical protein
MSLTNQFTDVQPDNGGGLLDPHPDAGIGRLIPRSKVAEALGVCPRSVARYEKNDVAFPKRFRLNNRIFVREDDFEAYKRELLRRGLCQAQAI